jgi:hypothetical protein
MREIAKSFYIETTMRGENQGGKTVGFSVFVLLPFPPSVDSCTPIGRQPTISALNPFSSARKKPSQKRKKRPLGA